MKIALTSTFLACTLKLLQPLPIIQFHLDSFRYLHSNTLLFGTKICLSNLNNGHLCSHCSGGYMSIIKVQLNLISIERSLWLTDSLCWGWGGEEFSLSSYSFKVTNPIIKILPSWPNLITFQRDHLRIPSHWRLELQHVNFWRDTSILSTTNSMW